MSGFSSAVTIKALVY